MKESEKSENELRASKESYFVPTYEQSELASSSLRFEYRRIMEHVGLNIVLCF